jgi:hypothetical protein
MHLRNCASGAKVLGTGLCRQPNDLVGNVCVSLFKLISRHKSLLTGLIHSFLQGYVLPL